MTANPEWINIRICPTTPTLISDNTQVRKKYFDSNMIQKGNMALLRCVPKDYLTADIDRSKCLHAMSSNALFCTPDVGNVIYHKFSHGDVSYSFKEKRHVRIPLGVWCFLCCSFTTSWCLMFFWGNLFGTVNPHYNDSVRCLIMWR